LDPEQRVAILMKVLELINQSDVGNYNKVVDGPAEEKKKPAAPDSAREDQ